MLRIDQVQTVSRPGPTTATGDLNLNFSKKTAPCRHPADCGQTDTVRPAPRLGARSLLRAAGLSLLLAVTSLPVVAAPSPGSAEAAAEQQAASVLAHITQGTWITEGHSSHVIYIFFDPNCPYCHKLYEELRPWVARNAVELHWLPVGVLTPTSPAKAAALLAAKNRLAAFRQSEQKFRMGSGFGNILKNPAPAPAIAQELRTNEALLDLSGSTGVPEMVFRLQDGTPIAISGAPPTAMVGRIIDHLR